MNTSVSTDVFLRLLLDVPHDNHFTSCYGSDRTINGAYSDVSLDAPSLFPKESSAL